MEQSLRTKFRIILAQLELSKSELAQRVGVSRHTVYQVTNGKWIPSRRVGAALARELGQDPKNLWPDLFSVCPECGAEPGGAS